MPFIKGTLVARNANDTTTLSFEPARMVSVRNRAFLGLLLSTTVFVAGPAFAQSTEGEAATLDTISVSGEKPSPVGPDATIVAKNSLTSSKTDTPLLDAPASVSVVTEKELRQRAVTNLDEALSYTPGVATDTYGSDDRYDHYLIRGFYQTTNGTYRDGLPKRIPVFTDAKIEPYGMQRIEVLKGSNSTLFGLSGPGGIVNAITKQPKDQKFGEVYTSFGEDHLETGVDFGGPLDAEGLWSYRLTSKWQNGNADIDHTNDDRVYIAPAITYSPSDDTSFTLLTDFNKRDGSTSNAIPFRSTVSPDTYVGEPDFDKFNTIERNIGYQFRHDFNNGLQFRQNARYSTTDLTYESVYIGSPDLSANRSAYAVYGDLSRFAIDNQLQYDVNFGRFDSRTLFGFDYTSDRNNETLAVGSAGPINVYNPVYCGRACVILGAPSASETNLTTRGVYLQEELTLDERWILTLGGRYDHAESESISSAGTYRATDTDFTKRAGVTFKATEEVSLYANYSESFLPVAANRTTFVGTPKPQTGEQYEIGAKYQPIGIDALFTVALFDLTQSNVTQWNASYTQQYQVGEINNRGIEFESKVALNDSLNVTAAYSYWDAQIKDNVTASLIGKRPARVPHHLAQLWVDYTIPGEGKIGDLTLGAGARFFGGTFADDANSIKLPSRTVFDAVVNYKVTDNVALAVNATNLFDRKYVSHVDTFGNTAYYGDRRTVKGTLRYTW